MSEQLMDRSTPPETTVADQLDSAAMRRLQEAYGLELSPEAQDAYDRVTEHHVDDLEKPHSSRTHRRATREAGPVQHVEVEDRSNVIKLPVRRIQNEDEVTVTAEDRRKAAYPDTGRTHRRATREAGPSPYATETTNEPKPGQLKAVLAKNGSRRVYQYDDNLKLRPFKQAEVLGHYGVEARDNKAEMSRLESVEADASMPSVALTAEQETQLEKAIATHDRSMLPVALTDAEWAGATGLALDATESVETPKLTATETHDALEANPFPESVISNALWADLTPAERSRAMQTTEAPAGYEAIWQDLTEFERANFLRRLQNESADAEPETTPAPVEQPAPARPAGAHRDGTSPVTREIRMPRRKFAAGIAAAALAIVSIFGAAASPKEAGATAPKAQAHTTELPNKASLDLSANTETRTAPKTVEFTLGQRGGDSIWQDLEHYAQAHGAKTDTAAVDRAKDAVLKYNHISESGARHMGANQHYTIPREVLDQLLRASK